MGKKVIQHGPDKEKVFVTRPVLPPLEDFMSLLEKIWKTGILTNNGPFHNELEEALCRYLGVKHISLFANGTIALLTALQALRISGEVITTPFSFVATTHSLWWNRIKPVFVDIDRQTMNLDPKKIEAAITAETTAIMPVHCYGRPCDVDAIKAVAEKYNLKVVYDAAHAFGVKCHCGSVLNHGDLSVLSFHATKVFNTFEGGAIVSQDAETKKYVDQLKNFGFTDEVTIVAAGINGKMSELNAAVGLLQLNYVDGAIARRREIDKIYRAGLALLKGIECVGNDSRFETNYSYFPILVKANYGATRDELYQILKNDEIYARRYFYPLISDIPIYRSIPSAHPCNLPVATEIAQRVLCLPIYPALSNDQIYKIIAIIRSMA